MVRVTLSDTELQTLRPGELYEVPPSIGRVLVSEGWAVEAVGETRDLWRHPDRAGDDKTKGPRSS